MRLPGRRRDFPTRGSGERFAAVDSADDERVAAWVREALRSGEAPDEVLAAAQVVGAVLAGDGVGGYRAREVESLRFAVSRSLRYYELLVSELASELSEARSALGDVQATVELLRTVRGRVLADADGGFVDGEPAASEFAEVEGWLRGLRRVGEGDAGSGEALEPAEPPALPAAWTVTEAATADSDG